MSRSASLAILGTTALIGAAVLTLGHQEGAGWLMLLGGITIILMRKGNV